MILTGIEIDTNDTKIIAGAIKDVFREGLKLTIEPKKVLKIGSKTCLVEMENMEDKRKLMENKYKLKEIKDKRIYVNDDLTKNELEIRKKLRAIAQEEKLKGKEVKIGYSKLTVDGNVWRWNKSKDKLELDTTKN